MSDWTRTVRAMLVAERQRPLDLAEQRDPTDRTTVPGRVGDGVVEEHTFAVAVGHDGVADLHGRLVATADAEVVAEHPGVGTGVLGELRARLEHRPERGPQPGMPPQRDDGRGNAAASGSHGRPRLISSPTRQSPSFPCDSTISSSMRGSRPSVALETVPLGSDLG